MVKPVTDVIQKIDALPPADREVLTRFLSTHFDEVLSEARWSQLFESSSSTLDAMVREVNEAIRNGDVAELDPDEL
jgi:hypothetical protein